MGYRGYKGVIGGCKCSKRMGPDPYTLGLGLVYQCLHPLVSIGKKFGDQFKFAPVFKWMAVIDRGHPGPLYIGQHFVKVFLAKGRNKVGLTSEGMDLYPFAINYRIRQSFRYPYSPY